MKRRDKSFRLTEPDGDRLRRQENVPGMFYFAGTAPAPESCKRCRHFLPETRSQTCRLEDGRYGPVEMPTGKGVCRKAVEATGKKVKFYDGNHACKYFDRKS